MNRPKQLNRRNFACCYQKSKIEEIHSLFLFYKESKDSGGVKRRAATTDCQFFMVSDFVLLLQCHLCLMGFIYSIEGGEKTNKIHCLLFKFLFLNFLKYNYISILPFPSFSLQTPSCNHSDSLPITWLYFLCIITHACAYTHPHPPHV